MQPGDILSHAEMCQQEGQMLQRGMTFRTPPAAGVILMSQRPSAPYVDSIDDDGNLLYEGHDVPRSPGVEPKVTDQPRALPSGKPTENGKFADWTDRAKAGDVPPALFNVYEKIRDGIWTYRGPFVLRDYRYEHDGRRYVFRFVLAMTETMAALEARRQLTQSEIQTRQIPTWVKQLVFKRDKGRCVQCGATDQLHFDHDLPYSRGGASATPDNVQLLCARHNLSKGASIR